jgi:DNA polymerase
MNLSNEDALHILEWYVEAGVDEVILDKPQNRFVAPHPAPEPIQSTPAPAQPKQPTLLSTPATPPSAAMEQARQAAELCTDMEALVEAIHAFEGCSIKKVATNTVIYDGNPKADILIIGEAPGAEEDRKGIPFCGPAGQLLDRMLAAIDLNRENVCISNTLYWRPPGNRQPSIEELTICRPFVQKLVQFVNPKLLILAGGTAAKAMLDTTQGVSRLRRSWYEYKQDGIDPIQTAVLYHPAYLLRQPTQKKLAWQDLLKIKAFLDDNS